MAAQRKVNQDMYARLFKLLMERPVSAHEISEKVGMHIVNAQGLMRTLKRHGVVHVYSWRPDALGRDQTPVYVMGDGVDKPRRKLTQAERARNCRIRKQMKQEKEEDAKRTNPKTRAARPSNRAHEGKEQPCAS